MATYWALLYLLCMRVELKLCGQINNIIYYFGKHDPITKLSSLKALCTL